MAEPTILVPKGAATPHGLAQTLVNRARTATVEGRPFYAVICMVTKLDNGNHDYSTFWTAMPGEIALMAAYEVTRHMEPKE